MLPSLFIAFDKNLYVQHTPWKKLNVRSCAVDAHMDINAEFTITYDFISQHFHAYQRDSSTLKKLCLRRDE